MLLKQTALLQAANIMATARSAATAIPPLWPLTTSVAVNPFLGHAGESLACAGARLARVAGCPVTMPRSWYAARIASGEISDADLLQALDSNASPFRPASLAELKEEANAREPASQPLPTIADLAAQVSGIDWPDLVADRIGAWAAGYFDEGQALWSAPRTEGAYKAWRTEAFHDLTPEIAGLEGFARRIAENPEDAESAILACSNRIGLPAEAMETYFHQLLITMGGWAQYARYRLWQAELEGKEDAIVTDMLAIRLSWETALFDLYVDRLADNWRTICAAHAAPVAETRDFVVSAILQDSYDRSFQRLLSSSLALPASSQATEQPLLQAAFCIDVRSEVFRRNLEAVQSGILTLGFAGFFGLGTAHHAFASDVKELRLPVLLTPGVSSHAEEKAGDQATQNRIHARAKRAWGRFKLAAVSSFAFVEASGPLYAVKLVRDAIGLRSNPAPSDPLPVLDPCPSFAAKTSMAESVLRAMSLTSRFARLVVLCGHGANTVNNPHASALHCGACGGYSGEVNARLLAALLNDADVRQGLALRGILIPPETLFLGALHDTTTDRVTLYADDHPSSNHRADIAQARGWFAAAGEVTRNQRALRLPRGGKGRRVFSRSRDWAEIRPEWALAGCRAFIAAPRTRTAGRNLQGQVFLHDYEWKQDKEFNVLELIMTAPVVVASWISLQYYGSTVAPGIMGAGNKLLHNVTGGITVVEGNGGSARVGLPWQSVYDGNGYAHDPLRLSVCIEAPREAMTTILAAHDHVRQLFDNSWMHLFAIDEAGRLAWKYDGNLQWTKVEVSYHEAIQGRLEPAA